MSMNKYMHPRNIYKSPPNFKQLALDFPEFQKFVQQDFTGKVSLDFKNLESLRALSCVLLKKDFNLDVHIPLNKLIPTIPLRLNYILWIEDLLQLFADKGKTIQGIDVGTGASCVYPLLGAKKNSWRFVATELDSESVAVATENVKRNNLEHLISIVHVQNENLIMNVVGDGKFDFCMCNPPFFSSPKELHPFFKARTRNRPHPKNAFCATENEVVSKGGEVEFIAKLIHESKMLGNKVAIYTTMIGHKSSIAPLKKLLRELEVYSFKESEFCQGNTTRWGLAWTFENIDLRKVTDPVKLAFLKSKPKPPVTHVIPLESVHDNSLNIVTDKIMDMFKTLHFSCEEVSRNKVNLRYYVTAFSNTWSNQRRKRRTEKRLNSSNELEMEEITHNNNPPVEDHSDSLKRGREENLEGSLFKKLRLSSESSEASEGVFFKFVLSIKQFEKGIVLDLNCASETDNRDYLYQILQYIKNNYIN